MAEALTIEFEYPRVLKEWWGPVGQNPRPRWRAVILGTGVIRVEVSIQDDAMELPRWVASPQAQTETCPMSALIMLLSLLVSAQERDTFDDEYPF